MENIKNIKKTDNKEGNCGKCNYYKPFLSDVRDGITRELSNGHCILKKRFTRRTSKCKHIYRICE